MSLKDINYANLNYYGSKVSLPKSQEGIKKILNKFDLQGIRFTECQLPLPLGRGLKEPKLIRRY